MLHGAFYDFDIKSGKKTLADAWEIVPYENFISTAGLTKGELIIVLDECLNVSFSSHRLDGFKVSVAKNGKQSKVTDITLSDGKPLDVAKRYRIALNSFDAQSGGQRFPKLREIASSTEAKSEVFPVQSREALVEYFTEKKHISKQDLA